MSDESLPLLRRKGFLVVRVNEIDVKGGNAWGECDYLSDGLRIPGEWHRSGFHGSARVARIEVKSDRYVWKLEEVRFNWRGDYGETARHVVFAPESMIFEQPLPLGTLFGFHADRLWAVVRLSLSLSGNSKEGIRFRNDVTMRYLLPHTNDGVVFVGEKRMLTKAMAIALSEEPAAGTDEQLPWALMDGDMASALPDNQEVAAASAEKFVVAIEPPP